MVQLSPMSYSYQMRVTTYYQPSVKPLPNYVLQPYFVCDSLEVFVSAKIWNVQFLIITRRKQLDWIEYITAACI